MPVACPLCRSEKLVTLFKVNADQSAAHFVDPDHERERNRQLAEATTRLWGREQARVAECDACGFGFADPFVAGDTTFYELALGPSGYLADKWDFRVTIDALERNGIKGGRILEVGAGDGHFLDRVSPSLFAPEDVTAIEYNSAAKAKLMKAGYHVETVALAQLASRGSRFSAVFLFQVLEHLDHAHENFGALSQLVEPGGSLFLSVPNPAYIRFNELNGSLLDMPPSHVGRWSIGNLSQMADRYGFDVSDSSTQPFSYSDYIKQDLVYSFTRRAQRGNRLAKFLLAKRKSKLGRVGAAAGVAAFGPLRVPVWIKAGRRSQRPGGSIWVHLTRRAGS